MTSTSAHPDYGAPLTTGKISLTNGVVFRPYKAGPRLTVRCSDDHRVTLIPQPQGWLAFIDGRPVVGKAGERLRFVTREEAERSTAVLVKQTPRNRRT